MKRRKSEEYIGLGLIFGMLGGVIFDNIALGLCFGLLFGAAMSAKHRKADSDSDETGE